MLQSFVGALNGVFITTSSFYSNLNPVAKKSTYKEMISRDSLKLREMARLTTDVDDWKQGAFQAHEEEMIALLRATCEECYAPCLRVVTHCQPARPSARAPR